MKIYKVEVTDPKTGKKTIETVPWSSPGGIRYLRDDIIWMIATVLPLEAGKWPAEPVETGYTGSQKTPSHSAPFENPGQVRAEVEYRLALTKKDGDTLKWEIQKQGVEYYDLLCPAAKNALNYICSGKGRRYKKKRKENEKPVLLPYSEWLRNRKWNDKKKHKNVLNHLTNTNKGVKYGGMI